MAYLRKVRIHVRRTGYLCMHSSAASSIRKHGSAGIIVIGEEILKGQVADTNSHFIARHLFDLGIKVNRISVIGDQEDEIAEEVQLFSKKFSYVITTGGIGPTHDDVTFSAVAKAFGEEVKPHPELVRLCSDFFHTEDLNSPAMKLAHVPESAKLIYGYDKIKRRRTLYPNISVHNVYIFPGIPSLMERLFLAVYEELFKEGGKRMHVKDLYLLCTEVEFADQLNMVVSRHPNVSFGSYPKMFNRYYKVHVTIQSVEKEDCEEAYYDLVTTLPKEFIVHFDDVPTHNTYQKIMDFGIKKGKKHVQHAMEKIEHICQTHRPSEICVVFNGDPESVVMVHLIHAYLRKNSEHIDLSGITFTEETSSSEVEEFIQETQERYGLKLEKFSGSLNDSLRMFIGSNENCKAVFVGHSSNENFNVQHLLTNEEKFNSSIQWINLLEEWTTDNIWDFIHSLYLPYSKFYDGNS